MLIKEIVSRDYTLSGFSLIIPYLNKANSFLLFLSSYNLFCLKRFARWFLILMYFTYCMYCTVGWVNLYQKFKIEKYTVFGKLIFPKKIERHLKKKKLGTTGLRICMNLRIFASLLYPTLLKICSQKFDRK